MCFMLYAATAKPLPRRKWERGSSQLSVELLTKQDAAAKAHFSHPEVQCIGSTSGCGCDFPHVLFRNGGWLYNEYPEVEAQQAASERVNREELVSLLQATEDSMVELYGLWYGDFAKAPEVRETIPVETILDPGFHLKEGGFYKVRLEPEK